jgi:hypothetical protein
MPHSLSAFLLCAALSAQVAPHSPRSEDKCSVEGTVVNAVTGEPLKKVHLTLRPLGPLNGVPYGTMTDNAGHFLIDDVDPGRYKFAAARNGFVGQTYSPQGSPNRNAPLALANGQHLKEMVFKLTPQGVISGRILDEDGDPLANVEVQCLVYSYQRGKRALVNHAGSSTNDLGEFRLFGLGPGKYVISATDQSRDIFDPERTVGTAQTILDAEARGATIYYPTGTNPEGASSLEITPGAQISGINMTLTRVRAVSVKGHVSIKSAAAQRNMNIMLTARGVNGFRT